MSLRGENDAVVFPPHAMARCTHRSGTGAARLAIGRLNGEGIIAMGEQSVERMGPPEEERPLADREIDIELLAFVERYATSPVKWDLIVFFGENAYTRDTAFSIASRIGRDMKIVLPELGDLVVLGLLEQTKINGETVYHLTQEPSLRQAAFRFVRYFSGARFHNVGRLSGLPSSTPPSN